MGQDPQLAEAATGVGASAVFVDGIAVLAPSWTSSTGPSALRLDSRAPDLVRKLRETGRRVVLVSNEPDIASGRMTCPALESVHQRLMQLLNRRHTQLDGVYYSPDDPEALVAEHRRDTEWRLPRLGMLEQAVKDLHVNLDASWTISVSPDHAAAGERAGCRAIIVSNQTADTPSSESGYTAGNFEEAVKIVLSSPSQPTKTTLAAMHQQSERSKPLETPATEPSPARLESILEQLNDQLRQSNRLKQYDDFSLSRLAASIVQILALGLAGWAAFELINLSGVDPLDSAQLRLGGAIFLQLLALALFLISTRDR